MTSLLAEFLNVTATPAVEEIVGIRDRS